MAPRSSFRTDMQCVSVDELVRRYVNGFEGGPPATYEWYLDPRTEMGGIAEKGMIIICIYTRVSQPKSVTPVSVIRSQRAQK